MVETTVFDRQIEVERMMQGLGKDRYESTVKRAITGRRETHTQYGHRLMAVSVEAVSTEIRAFIEAKSTSGKAGRGNIAVKYLKMVDADVAAYIALRVIIDSLSHKQPLVWTCLTIGKMVEDEVRLTHFKTLDKESYKRTTEHVKRATSYRHKRTVAVWAMNNKAGIEWDSWPKSDKIHVGSALVDAVIQGTGIVSIEYVPVGKQKVQAYVRATQKTREWIEEQNARNPLLAPLNLPCVVKPKRYTGPFGGGYYTQYVPPVKLVKTRNRAYLEELEARWDDLTEVTDAIHAMQETGWKINTAVLEVAQALWQSGQPIAKLPPLDDQPLPLCPVCGAVIDDTARKGQKHACLETCPEARREWKKAATAVHETNARLWSKRMQVQKIFWIADMYRDDTLFFPYQLDFRGRVYAVPDYLNPQGCDLAKGLLLFAEAKPINTDDAERWFFIHGANCFGEDKMAFDGRVEWVKAHHAEIIASATDPHNNLWWADADKPWQFLAWAMEYKAYSEQGRGYMSRCVISMDGSCNGLQHFSAMLRDPVGGKATNLLPSDTPQDIYQIVADKVNAVLDSIIKTSEDMEQVDMAHKWRLFGVSRKLAKRPVMVLPYGGTLFSCRQYVEDYLKEQVEAGAESPWPVEQYLTATQFLATLIWDAIGDTVQSARRAMDWLQAAAKVAADENLPLSWETPSGFPVIQAYPETKSKQVETHIAGQLTKISLSRDTDDIDKRRQAQGISPNFVHSLDAAAMVKAILYAQTDGVTAFAMVHDSYGTHAADAEAMALSLRKAFVDMYGNCNVLEDFRQAVLAMVSEKNAPKILPCPDMGDLDITRVMLSDFFFA